MSGTVSFHTLGCRLNIFETDGLASIFSRLGVKTVEESENPDIVVINTCTVTNKADSKNRNIIRNAIKNNPGADIWVTGCYAETDKLVIEKIPGITGVIGNTEKSKLPYLALEKKGQPVENTPIHFDRFSYSDVLPEGHTRAYLKVQDGCNRRCSYCKIPFARGKGESRKEEDILNQVKFLQDNGVGEIILTGVNIGWYRDAEGSKAFNRLLKKILDVLEYSRIRISSIEPSDVGHELIDLTLHPRFCNFLHVPLQSGSSAILKKMRRSYTADTFIKRIEAAKKKNPSLFIGTDIITGFPGETEEDFQESIRLVKILGISKIHAFPFSIRKDTEAENYKETVSKEEKKRRVLELNTVSRLQYKEFGLSQVGKTKEAILESDGTCITDDYLKVRLTNDINKLKTGQFLNLKITGFNDESLREECFIGSLA